MPKPIAENFMPILTPARGIVAEVAEAAIRLAEDEGDHEKAKRLREIWLAATKCGMPF